MTEALEMMKQQMGAIGKAYSTLNELTSGIYFRRMGVGNFIDIHRFAVID